MLYRFTILASLILFMNVNEIYSQTTPFKRIMITVSDASTGLPVENAEVNFKGLIFKQKKKTDKLGIAIGEIYLASGAQTINVEIKNEIAGGGHKLYKTSVVLVAGQDFYNHAALVKPLYKKITVAVVDEKNQPVSNASVTIKGNPDETVQTTANGTATFSVANPEGSLVTSLSIKRDGYELFKTNIDLNDQSSQIPVTTVLKTESTIRSSSYDVSKPAEMLMPTQNVTPTFLPKYSQVQNLKVGPYEPVCEPPLSGMDDPPPSWAVTEEKDLLENLSSSCLKPINDLMNAMLSCASQYADIAYEVSGDQKSSNYVFKTMDKAKSLWSKLQSIDKDPATYSIKCLETGTLTYLFGNNYKNYMAVTGYRDDLKKFTKEFDEKITTIQNKINANQDVRRDVFFTAPTWLQGWKTMDGFAKSFQSAASLFSDLSKGLNPEAFLSYYDWTKKALERANNTIETLHSTCRVYEAEEQIKEALGKGRTTLAGTRIMIARLKKRIDKTGSEIDDIVTKNYPGLKNWRSLKGNDARQQLGAIWPYYTEWSDAVKQLSEAEYLLNETQLLLRRIDNACMRLGSMAIPVNDRVKKYLELFDKGIKAANECDFITAEPIVKQLKALDGSECGHYFPRQNGLPGSQDLEQKIASKKVNPPCNSSRGKLPVSLSIWHRTDLLWKTDLTFVKTITATSAEYKGTNFEKKPAEGSVQIEGDKVYIYVSVPSQGYQGAYVGKLAGNIVEGEYTPSSGFGPRAYFKAQLTF